jgi:hypothetical protein
MIITILGSCRQQSISSYANITSIKEKLTYPHYTKEIIQALQYCKGISTFDNSLTAFCFRTGFLEKKEITYQKELQDEFEKTDLFVVEIASRIAYEWKDVYVHHILSEANYEFPDRSSITIRELSDEEIEQDIVTIQDLVYPKKLLIVPHIYTKTIGKRFDFVCLLQQITSKYGIPFLDPSKELMGIDGIYQEEYPLHHYSDKGHSLVGQEYKKAIKIIMLSGEKPLCVHNYLTHCSTNWLPPGLADFLRGTIALYYFTKQYNYTLLLDNSHPFFRYLQSNPCIISNTIFPQTVEIIPPLSYEEIYARLQELFQSQRSVCLLTNSFYTVENGGGLVNFGPITEDCRTFLQSILRPIDRIEDMIHGIFTNVYQFNKNEDYKVIHLRCGDRILHDNLYDDGLYSHYYEKIYPIVTHNKDTKYILLSDSSKIACELQKNIPGLYYWNNEKVHLGRLNQSSSAIMETLVDFFIMSRSKEILTGAPSGFSVVISLIYNIKCTSI